MADTGLREILDAMVEELQALTASSFPMQVERGMVLNPTPPTIDVYVTDPPRDFDYAAFGDIAGGYQITARARVTTSDNDAGQDLLISFMDDTDELCIPAVFDAEPTLNGLASSMALVGCSGHRAYETPDGNAHLGCQFDFLVLPARS